LYFAIATFLAFYFLIGYPLLLVLLPPASGPEVKKDLAFQPTVSIVIAVYNGAAFMRRKLETLLALAYPREKVQILIVSDGSTDETERICVEFQPQGVRLLSVPKGARQRL
jgi:cellulose synthase/poly-beta-1,6-N-acetylglucosamine synthase-like glycosyltransferase